MCYAIPGKVLEINTNTVTVDYFGERKRAKNDFFALETGDYVYAQGGFVVQKVSEREALPILESWKELFFKLQEIDLELTQRPQTLYQRANYLRQKYSGNSCCIHGIIEFSNYCRSDCLYCGIRKNNNNISRYRMSIAEIVEAADDAVNKLGFKALVLQSGEDPWYDAEKISLIISQIRERCPALLILSLGEREEELYQKAYQAGARGVLLRFESSNPTIYEKVRPGHLLQTRIGLIEKLRDMGFLVMTGFLIGLPGQTQVDILRDIELTNSLGAQMFSFGPFIPHPQTPLADYPRVTLEKALNTIAQARLKNPEARILVTTALETLDKENGLRFGLLSGGNSLMINLTPERYRALYEIYPPRAGTEQDTQERINSTLNLLRSIGRAPTDLGL